MKILEDGSKTMGAEITQLLERRLKKALKHLRKSREQSRLLLLEAKAVKAILFEIKQK